MSYQYKDEDVITRKEDQATKDPMIALQIDAFLEKILESPNLLKKRTIASLCAVPAIFNVDAFFTLFTEHEDELLSDLMFMLIMKNWSLIEEPAQYLEPMIDHAFVSSIRRESFVYRITAISNIIENEMLKIDFYASCILTFQIKVHMIMDIKEAMIVFALSTIHESSAFLDQWEEKESIHEVLKFICKFISECDGYSELFVKCLNIINNESSVLEEIIEIVDIHLFEIKLMENENTTAFSEIVKMRLTKYPEEGLDLLHHFAENNISSELIEMKKNVNENFCRVIFDIFKYYNLREIITDEKISEVINTIVEVVVDCEDEGFQIYSFLIREKLFDLFDKETFIDGCEHLLDNEDNKEKHNEETKQIGEFLETVM